MAQRMQVIHHKQGFPKTSAEIQFLQTPEATPHNDAVVEKVNETQSCIGRKRAKAHRVKKQSVQVGSVCSSS